MADLADAAPPHRRPHHPRTPRTDTTTTGLLCTATGLFLHGQGALTRATTYLHRSLTTTQRLHGPDHPSTLTSRNNLAYAYEAAGDLTKAIPLFGSPRVGWRL